MEEARPCGARARLSRHGIPRQPVHRRVEAGALVSHVLQPYFGECTIKASVPVSVVIPTYNRCEDCQRAVRSVLEQEPAPLEVIVCDDGSTDGTRAEFERWQAEEPRLRYLRLPRNRGTPAPARNLGIASAQGEWIGFLDDDDRWLPGKLALHAPMLATKDADVIATDAVRSNGQRYFGLGVGAQQPARVEIEQANPVVLSSAVVRRSVLLSAHGFDESRAIAGIEDYDLWLRLADRGVRFVILDAATVAYSDHGSARLSSRAVRTYLILLRVRLRRLFIAPRDRIALLSTLRDIRATALLITRSLFQTHEGSPV